MGIEHIFEEIKQDKGEAVFSNGEQLLNVFADYSKGKMKPQQNLLDIFLKCDGNVRILKLKHASACDLQAEYHKLIQEMVRLHNIREDAATEVCAAFWRVVLGEEPPISKPQFEPEPDHPSKQPVNLPQPYDAPCTSQKSEKIKEALWDLLWNFLGLSKLERATFLMGVYGITVSCIQLLRVLFRVDTTYTEMLVNPMALLFYVWLLVMPFNMFHLWKEGFDYEGILDVVEDHRFLRFLYILWLLDGYFCGPFLGFFVLYSILDSSNASAAWTILFAFGAIGGFISSIIWAFHRAKEVFWMS